MIYTFFIEFIQRFCSFIVIPYKFSLNAQKLLTKISTNSLSCMNFRLIVFTKSTENFFELIGGIIEFGQDSFMTVHGPFCLSL